MKKIYRLIIFALILNFIYISKANAFVKVGDVLTLSGSKSTDSHDTINYFVNGVSQNNYNMWFYKLGDYDNAYCADAGRPNGLGKADRKVSRILNPNDADDLVFLYLINGGDYDKKERTLAIRAYTPLSHQDNGDVGTICFFAKEAYQGNNSDLDIAYANWNSGIQWAEDYLSNFKKVKKALKEDVSGLDDDDDIYDKFVKPYKANLDDPRHYYYDKDSILDENDSDVANAKKLFGEALKFAAEKSGQNNDDRKVSINKSPSYVSGTERIVGADTNSKTQAFQRDVEFEVSFKNYKDVSDPVNIDAYTNKGDITITSLQYKKSGEKNASFTTFTSDTDFSDLIDSNSTTFIVRATISGSVSKNEKVKFKLIVDATSYSKIGFVGAKVRNAGDEDPVTGCNYQSFFIGEKDSSVGSSNTDSFEFNLTWDPSQYYCVYGTVPAISDTMTNDELQEVKEFMQTCCRDTGNEKDFSLERECKKSKNSSSVYCKREKEYCDVCNSTKSIPTMCSSFANNDSKEAPHCSDGADANITGPNNIKLCVIDYTDDANNSYKLSTKSIVSKNPYCSIYCKEDYKIGLPVGKWVKSGSAFTIDIKVDGTKTCYTDGVNFYKFLQDAQYATNLIKQVPSEQNIDRLNEIMRLYRVCNTLSTGNSKTDEELFGIKTSSQKVQFSYSEDYLKDSKNKKIKVDLKKVKSETTLTDSWLCSGEVDMFYNICSTKAQSASNIEKQPLNGVFNCYDGRCTVDNIKDRSNEIIYVPKTSFAKRTSIYSAVFAPSDDFVTKYGSGTSYFTKDVDDLINITKTVNDKNKLKEYSKKGYTIYTKRVYVDGEMISQSSYPVQLNRAKGAFSYSVYFDGFGEYYNNGKQGRLISKSNSSVVTINDDTPFNGEYVCAYVVNCTACDVIIDGVDIEYPGTRIVEPSKEVVEKVGCEDCNVIIDPLDEDGKKNDFKPVIRQISTENVKPNNRNYGYNLLNSKGKTAILEIEEKADKIYSDDNKPEYEITLTPAILNEIKKYNDKNKKITIIDYDQQTCTTYHQVYNKNKKSAGYKSTETYDYSICKSELLEYLDKHTDADIKNNITYTPWAESEYCKKNKCIIGRGYGYDNIYGPAYK